MDSFNKYLSKKRALIDKRLDTLLPKEKIRPQSLHRAIRYSVFTGGKRIRPILAIEACKASGGKTKDILNAACAIEMVHTFSLIHDDLPSMDNDDYRRGKPSCHKKFGEATAILAGDALLTLAFGVLAKEYTARKDRVICEAVDALSKAIGSLGMAGGQEVDLKKKFSLRKRDLDFITEKKTASLFEASMVIGAIFGNALKRDKERLGRFGRLLGFAFQLLDDLFDNDGYARIIGKEKTKQMALEFIKRAKKQLAHFGPRADRLKRIADQMYAWFTECEDKR